MEWFDVDGVFFTKNAELTKKVVNIVEDMFEEAGEKWKKERERDKDKTKLKPGKKGGEKKLCGSLGRLQ